MKKEVLIVSHCPRRGGSIGLIGELLKELSCLERNQYSLSLFDIDYSGSYHNRSDYDVDHFYKLETNKIDTIIRHIPKIGPNYFKNKTVSTFNSIISSKSYDAVVFFPVVYYADELIHIAHNNGAKVIFYPWGSEILRCSGKIKSRLMKAFSDVDYVVGAINANTLRAAKEIYGVNNERIKEKKPFVSNIAMIDEIKGKYSRKQMSEILNINDSKCNIVCSYNGYATHRHEFIIDAIAQNKDSLPIDYQLIFPMTYGSASGYIDAIASKCKEKGLNAVFLTNFMSVEQMACLHFLTDLFIEIQPTDAGNGFIIEALYAQNEIITGSWLHYSQFEEFGIPYHLIDTIDELPNKLYEFFKGNLQKPLIPQQIIDMYSVPSKEDRCFFWERLFN